MASNHKQPHEPPRRKIKIGRLFIDPVVAMLFGFFALSALLLQLFIWLSLTR